MDKNNTIIFSKTQRAFRVAERLAGMGVTLIGIEVGDTVPVIKTMRHETLDKLGGVKICRAAGTSVGGVNNWWAVMFDGCRVKWRGQ